MKAEVNNFDKILPLLKWEKEGDYYYCQLFLRKVDKTTSFGNKNNSARLIKTYCFFNEEQFLSKQEEIVGLCNYFKCRAGINLNKRNEESVGFELLQNLADRLGSKNYKGINGILNTTNGSVKSSDKYWLIDCDDKKDLQLFIDILNDENLRPENTKIIEILPTYKGFHICTHKFDVMYFDKKCKEINLSYDLHKNNPFVLFYPEQN